MYILPVSRPLIALLAVAAVVNVAGSAVARAEQKETERVDRTIPFAPGGTLHLKNFSGDIRITGTNGDAVVIAAVRRGTRERLDAIKLDIATSGSSISIDANTRDRSWSNRNDNVVETDFDIKVPPDTRLDVNAFSSEVHVSGVTGRHALHTFSGDVNIELPPAADPPELEVKTFSGNIKARMPEQTSGTIRFSSFSGELESDLPLTLERGSRRDLRARLNNGDGSELYFKTFSGDVRITKD